MSSAFPEALSSRRGRHERLARAWQGGPRECAEAARRRHRPDGRRHRPGVGRRRPRLRAV